VTKGQRSLPPVSNQKANQIFVDYNPDNSVLKQINFMHRNFQNARILLDKHGKEIKNKINFNDQLVFKQLTPGQSFGGRSVVPFEPYCNSRQKEFGFAAVKRRFPNTLTEKQI